MEKTNIVEKRNLATYGECKRLIENSAGWKSNIPPDGNRKFCRMEIENSAGWKLKILPDEI